jgi:hypothetical protein
MDFRNKKTKRGKKTSYAFCITRTLSKIFHCLMGLSIKGKKELLKTNLICVVRGVILGFTRIQFFQHMFPKKKKKKTRDTYQF